MINIEALRQINYVIEHDVVSSTYKYVLLKSVITACQKYDHLIHTDNNISRIPLGLIVEQWIFDYMPFVLKGISQQNNGNVLDKPIVENYNSIFDLLQLERSANWEYSFMQFRRAYENPDMPAKLSALFLQLSKKIAKKIIDMPMRYIGKMEYEIFSPEQFNFGTVSLPKEESYSPSFLIPSFGYFTVSKQHYDVFRYLGQTLYGTSTIMAKWKEKTMALNDSQTVERSIIDKLSGDELEVRETTTIRNSLADKNECVWSGKFLKGTNYDVDHVLPYSVWFNNDLWNMLPADRILNQQKKKHKIPAPELIEKRADVIKLYWNQYMEKWPIQFKSQLEVSLTGPNILPEELIDAAIESLCQKSHYLIYDRGHEQFDI